MISLMAKLLPGPKKQGPSQTKQRQAWLTPDLRKPRDLIAGSSFISSSAFGRGHTKPALSAAPSTHDPKYCRTDDSNHDRDTLGAWGMWGGNNVRRAQCGGMRPGMDGEICQ